MAADVTPLVEQFEELFRSYYAAKITGLAEAYPQKKSLEVSYSDLEKFSPQLADELLEKPDAIAEAAETALKGMPVQVLPDVKFEPHVRFFGLPNSAGVMVESIGAAHIGKLISVDCMVTKRTDIRPKVRIALLKCRLCDARFKIPMEKNTVLPEICESCKRRALIQDEEESFFVDLQKAEAQEPLEHLRGGAPATHIELWVEDDLVNTFFPGQRLQLTGILRIRPPAPVKGKSVSKLIYSKYLEVMHILKVEKEFEEVDISPEDRRKIIALSKDPDVYTKIAKSIAPSIYGHDEVKEALALQLFGGTPDKYTVDGGRIRNDVHILIIGDPGAAKCVSGDTRVLLADGTLKPIKEVVEPVLARNGAKEVDDGVYAHSNHDLFSLGLDGRVCETKATTFWKLKAPEYLCEIETLTGRKVRVTPEHPFFVTKDGLVRGVKAEDLEEGEFIATPSVMKLGGTPQRLPVATRGKTNANRPSIPEYLVPELASLMGFLVGDGYLRRTGSSYEISFTNSDDELIGDFSRKMEKVFSLKPSISSDKRRRHVLDAKVFSVELGRLMEGMGLIADSWNKRVPDEMMRSPEDVVREFLRAFFDCEAHVMERGPAIQVTSASETLLEQVRILLMRFGICSTLHKFFSRATNSTQKKTRYCRLAVCGEDAMKFAKAVGFNSTEKAEKLGKKLEHARFNTNIHVIPGLAGKLRSIREALRLKETQCGITRSTYRHYELGDRNPSKTALRGVLAAFGKRISRLGRMSRDLLEENLTPSRLSYLRNELWVSQQELANQAGVSQALISQYELGKTGLGRRTASQIANALLSIPKIPDSVEKDLSLVTQLADSHIFWDKVIGKRRVKPEEPWVYDLTVEGLHNFVANSIFVHNTRLIQYIARLAPKSVYVSGKSVSGAGLTASAERDELAEGGWTLKAGALVLSSNGIACVDEFDKIEDTERAAMHEVMESGTVSVAKAGIVARFNAKTSILAAANPKFGRFDPNMYPAQQFDIAPTLLSRFDLIFPIRDVLDEEKDKRTADHILLQHMLGGKGTAPSPTGRSLGEIAPPLEMDFLRKYIAYARRHIQPVLTPEANEKIKEFYVDLRKVGAQQGVVPITARYIEGLVRLSEASAKTRLSPKVELMDAQRAIKLVDFVLRATMMDKSLGIIDSDIISTGQPKSRVDKLRTVLDIVRELEKEFDMVAVERIIEEARRYDISEQDCRRYIDELLRKTSDFYEPKHGFVKIVKPKVD